MQAYSLMKALEAITDGEIEIEVIDYISPNHIRRYGMILINDLRERNIEKLKQFLAFFRAQKKFKLSRFRSFHPKFLEDKIEKSKYDVIIVGSDEVWRNFENVYWLTVVHSSKKMAYAVSSRNLNSKLRKEQIRFIRENLKEFDYIGVRDEITKNELYKAYQTEININCDPAFLVDIKFDRNSFKNKLYKKYQIPDKSRLVGIMLDERADVCKKIKEIYGDEYKLVSLYSENKKADYNLIDISPFEWVEVIGLLDCLITSYFHGVVYALKSNINFVAIDYAPKETSKIYDLLSRENLLDQYINAYKVQEWAQCKILHGILELSQGMKYDYSSVVCNQKKAFWSFRKKLLAILNENR